MNDDNISIVADIVSAYVSNNSVAQADLPKLIADVHVSLVRLAQGRPVDEPVEVKLTPAIPVRKSVTPDYIICLEDGKKFKSLKRHLSSSYNITPDEYRAKWGLPADYPMVAPNYAKSRSDLAKQMGLGHGRLLTQARKAASAR